MNRIIMFPAVGRKTHNKFIWLMNNCSYCRPITTIAHPVVACRVANARGNNNALEKLISNTTNNIATIHIGKRQRPTILTSFHSSYSHSSKHPFTECSRSFSTTNRNSTSSSTSTTSRSNPRGVGGRSARSPRSSSSQRQQQPRGITFRLLQTPLGSLSTETLQNQTTNQILFHISQNKKTGADQALLLIERLLQEQIHTSIPTLLDETTLVEVFKCCRRKSVDIDKLESVATLLLEPQFFTKRSTTATATAVTTQSDGGDNGSTDTPGFWSQKMLGILLGGMTKCHGRNAPDRALALLDRIIQCQEENQQIVVIPNSFAYNAILAGYAKHGLVRRAEDLLQRMHDESTGSNITSSSSSSPSSDAQNGTNGVDSSDDGGGSTSSGGPDTVSYSCVMNAISKSNAADAPKRSRALLERMLSSKILPDVVTWNSLLNCYANRGMAKEAEEWLERMETLQQKSLLTDGPNTISYNSVLNAWAKSDSVDAPQRAKELLRRMVELQEEQKQHDDNVQEEELQNGKDKDPQQYQKQNKSRQHKVQVEPNKITQTSFLLCFEKNNCMQEGYDEWEQITHQTSSSSVL